MQFRARSNVNVPTRQSQSVRKMWRRRLQGRHGKNADQRDHRAASHVQIMRKQVVHGAAGRGNCRKFALDLAGEEPGGPAPSQDHAKMRKYRESVDSVCRHHTRFALGKIKLTENKVFERIERVINAELFVGHSCPLGVTKRAE